MFLIINTYGDCMKFKLHEKTSQTAGNTASQDKKPNKSRSFTKLIRAAVLTASLLGLGACGEMGSTRPSASDSRVRDASPVINCSEELAAGHKIVVNVKEGFSFKMCGLASEEIDKSDKMVSDSGLNMSKRNFVIQSYSDEDYPRVYLQFLAAFPYVGTYQSSLANQTQNRSDFVKGWFSPFNGEQTEFGDNGTATAFTVILKEIPDYKKVVNSFHPSFANCSITFQ